MTEEECLRAQRGQERCVLQGRDNEERRCKDHGGLCTFFVAFRKKSKRNIW